MSAVAPAFYREFYLGWFVLDETRGYVGGWNAEAAWVAVGEVTPPERDLRENNEINAFVKRILDAQSPRQIVVFPRKLGLDRIFCTQIADSGLPLWQTLIGVDARENVLKAVGALLNMIVKLRCWPEVADRIERGRAELGLPCLAPEHLH